MKKLISFTALAGVALAVAIAWWGDLPGFSSATLCASALRAISLIGLNLIFGVVGMLAFGQAAFMALPAYVSGIVSNAGMPLPVALAAGFVFTVMLARGVAAIFVRLPGVYLAVGTLGFGMVIEGLARAFPNWTGGASGLVFEPGRSIGTNEWAAIAFVALAISIAIYLWYVRGAVWRRLRAIRHDELAASVLGIDVHREKVRIFTIGCSYSAAGGLLLFYFVGVLIPEDAGVVRSLEQIGTLLLGGAGFVAGPVVGSFVVDWFFLLSGYAARYELFIYGALFLLIVMYAPQGISGLVAQGLTRGIPCSPATVRSVGCPESAQGLDRGIAAGASIQTTKSATSASPACLSVRGICQSFGGVDALVDVSFDVDGGEVFSLVGPNGAGKTTLFNIVSGVMQPVAGRIVLQNRDITEEPIHKRALSIGRSFQTPRLIPDLSVLANVLLRIDQLMPDLSEDQRKNVVIEQLRLFELDALAFDVVGNISLGQRKLIDIVRSCVGQPKLVLLDEPAVGLSASELVHLSDMIGKLSAQGCAVVIVEHNIEFVSSIAARGIVLDNGRQIARGQLCDIMAAENVKAAYFGALS